MRPTSPSFGGDGSIFLSLGSANPNEEKQDRPLSDDAWIVAPLHSQVAHHIIIEDVSQAEKLRVCFEF